MAGDLSRTLFDLVLNYYIKTSDSFFSFLELVFVVIYRNFRATGSYSPHSLSPRLPNLDPASLGYTC